MPDLLVEIGCEELPGGRLPSGPGAASGPARRAARPARASRPPSAASTSPPDAWPHSRSDCPASVRRSAPRCAARARTRPSRPWPGSPASTVSIPTRLERRDGFVWAVSEGSPTQLADLVPDVVRGLVEGIQFSKSMRYEGGRFSRPIRWLVVKLDDAVVPMRLAGLESGDTTYGHRYEGGHTAVGTAATYLADLRAVRAMAEASRAARGDRGRARLGGAVEGPRRQARRGRPPGRVAGGARGPVRRGATSSCRSGS